MPRLNADREDVLNALVTDLLADQVIRAFELDYTGIEIEDAVRRGLIHGRAEFYKGSEK